MKLEIRNSKFETNSKFKTRNPQIRGHFELSRLIGISDAGSQFCNQL
jgi:hypothetical protein